MYCQRCRTPLKLDGSLGDLNPAAFDLLVASTSQQQPKPPSSSRLSYQHDPERRALYDKVSKNAGPPTFKKHSSGLRPDGQLRDNSAMSFVLLTESQVAPPRLAPSSQEQKQSPSRQRRVSSSAGQRNDGRPAQQPHEAERIDKLFEILSARSDIDHPICVECTEMLVDGLQKRLEATSRERDAYAGFLKQVQADIPSEEDIAESEQALAQARKEEEESMNELLKLEKEKAALDREIIALEEEAQQLDAEEELFWRERNLFTTQLAEFQNERDSVAAKHEHDSQLLVKLQRANVYNDTFSIHHDGNFATINGLRLGRLSAKPVDWPEINAAWGQALLLVVTVADKLGYKFEGYEPLPMGSTSKIISYDYPSPASSRRLTAADQTQTQQQRRSGPPPAPKKTVLELYSSGDITSHLPWNRKFDKGMIAFLELVRQLGVHVHQQTMSKATATADGDYASTTTASSSPATAAAAAAAAAVAPLALPYKIDGDKIGDDRIGHFSIKLGLANNEEGWTKACKFALTCCKFLIAHASNVSHITNGR